MRVNFDKTKMKVVFLVAYVSSNHATAITELYELVSELPSICLPHQDGVTPISIFPNGTINKTCRLALHTVPLMLSVKQGSCCEYQF